MLMGTLYLYLLVSVNRDRATNLNMYPLHAAKRSYLEKADILSLSKRCKHEKMHERVCTDWSYLKRVVVF